MASSSNPSYNCSFTDLLNQSGTPQTPIFCTQTPNLTTQTSYIADDADDVDASPPVTNREVRRRWTVPEDGALVSAWLNTSKDCIVGNEQSQDTFWRRVHAYYSGCSAVKDLPPRKWNHCKQRWTKINEAVQKFCGCFDHAGRQATSGQSEDDVFDMAYKMYFQDQKNNFTLGHAWRMLRNEQKFCNLSKGKGKANTKRGHPDAPVAGSPMEEESRPVGVKAAKAAKAGQMKGTKKGTRTSEDREAAMKNLQTVAALREKDAALKDKEFANKDILANKKLLANLLGKTEPLDEIEMDLKNKLITSLFSG